MTSYSQNPTTTSAPGVVPLTSVPLTDWEKTGLSTIATGSGFSGGATASALAAIKNMVADPSAYVSPLAMQYLQQAGGYAPQAATAINSGMAPITQQDVQDVANPFSDALKNDLTVAGQKAKAALLANQGTRGARSFGDTSQGVENGMIDQQLLQQSGDIDYNTFNTALQAVQQQRQNSLTGGGELSQVGSMLGNLGTSTQGVTSSGTQNQLAAIQQLLNTGQVVRNNTLENAQNTVNAGQYVRNYNQGVDDKIQNNITTSQSYPTTNLTNILALLKNFQSGTSGAVPAANGLSTAGGLLNLAGGGLSSIANYIGAGNALDTAIGTMPEIF